MSTVSFQIDSGLSHPGAKSRKWASGPRQRGDGSYYRAVVGRVSPQGPTGRATAVQQDRRATLVSASSRLEQHLKKAEPLPVIRQSGPSVPANSANLGRSGERRVGK